MGQTPSGRLFEVEHDSLMLKVQDIPPAPRKDHAMNTIIVLLIFLAAVGGLIYAVTDAMWKSDQIEKGDQNG